MESRFDVSLESVTVRRVGSIGQSLVDSSDALLHLNELSDILRSSCCVAYGALEQLASH